VSGERKKKGESSHRERIDHLQLIADLVARGEKNSGAAT